MFILQIATSLAEVLGSEEAVEKREERKTGDLEITGAREPRGIEYTGSVLDEEPKDKHESGRHK